jgi:hypothetical protein
MLRRFVHWIVGLSRPGSDEDGDRDGGHAGSLLDASVNFAHGQEEGRDAVKSMQDINEKASRLQDADDRRR